MSYYNLSEPHETWKGEDILFVFLALLTRRILVEKDLKVVFKPSTTYIYPLSTDKLTEWSVCIMLLNPIRSFFSDSTVFLTVSA